MGTGVAGRERALKEFPQFNKNIWTFPKYHNTNLSLENLRLSLIMGFTKYKFFLSLLLMKAQVAALFKLIFGNTVC